MANRIETIREGRVRTCAFEFGNSLTHPTYHFVWFESPGEIPWYRPLDRLETVVRVWRPTAGALADGGHHQTDS